MNRAAMGPGGGNIWKAVKVAKNLNHESIPTNLTLKGLPIAPGDAANAFAAFFNEKTKTHVQNTSVSHQVYNGTNNHLNI